MAGGPDSSLGTLREFQIAVYRRLGPMLPHARLDDIHVGMRWEVPENELTLMLHLDDTLTEGPATKIGFAENMLNGFRLNGPKCPAYGPSMDDIVERLVKRHHVAKRERRG